MTLRLAFLFPAILSAQITAQFSQQPSAVARAYVGRPPDGLAVWGVVICSQHSATVTPGDIISAGLRRNVVLIAPQALAALGTQVVNRSAAQRTMDVGEGLALGGAILTAGQIVKADERWTFGMTAATGFLHWLAGRFEKRGPRVEQLRALQLPASITIPAGTCWTGITVGVRSDDTLATVGIPERVVP